EYSKVILPNDIFPEELITFILPKGPKRDTLQQHYGHLFQPAFWESIKKLYADDVIVDIKPYQPNLTPADLTNEFTKNSQ
ncbi:MAG: bifunctional isocitrate dehydrogenase kinase/phosphatase, partial [Cytophagales bacterium]|nr:bifunctional isocitrate dehydrogenase kinase/phosphatase [Cytophagales bacterium]